jgi:predicted metalloprotease with PDZ domain
MRIFAGIFILLGTTVAALGQVPQSAPTAPPPPPDPPCTYHLIYVVEDSPTVQVILHCSGLPAGRHTLVMPRAIPMGYGEQPYDKFVRNVRAIGASGDLFKVERDEGSRWRLVPPPIPGAVLERVEYEVDVAAMEGEILSASDTSKVRPGYVGILGYSVFGYLEGYEAQPVKLQVAAKEDWPVFLTLGPQFPAAKGKASALANDFYTLADSQILLGPKFVLRTTDAGVPLYVAIYGEGPADAERITGEAEATLERMIDYFGGSVFPFYTVHMELLKPVSERHRYFFSMEHLTSSTYYLGHERGLRADSPLAEVAGLRSLMAHHFAHAWIPKRAYGEGYFPHLWEAAPVLDTVWFSEGFGQYAALDALADAEGNEAAVFRARLVQRRFRSTLTEMPPFLLRLPLVEVSRIASTRYSEDFRTGRTAFSRGGLMAAEMDERIRSASGGQKRLRDALRFLVKWSQREKRGFRVDELPAIFSEATGVETRDILEKWLAPYTPPAANGGSRQ